MDYSMPGSSALHCFPKLAQIYVHWVSDAFQPSHPLSSPSPPALNLSQDQGLFKWVSSLHQVAKLLELQLSITASNEYSGLISFRINCSDLLAVKMDSQGSSPTAQFKSIKSLVLSLLYCPTLTSIHDYWKNCSFDYTNNIVKPKILDWSKKFIWVLPEDVIRKPKWTFWPTQYFTQ